MRNAGLVALAGLLAAAACKKEVEGSIYESSNLERAVVSFDDEIEGQRRDLAGPLSVTGGGRDWTVRVNAQAIEVHSPSASDLSTLAGLPDVRASLVREPISEELSLQILDAEGNLRYLVEPVEPGDLTFENFGGGFLAEASDLGSRTQGNFQITFVSAWMRTDTGDVELLPGEPQEVTIDGARWRAALLAGFRGELQSKGPVLCDGADSRLAFELLRLDAEADPPDLTPRERDVGVELPIGSCIPAPELPG